MTFTAEMYVTQDGVIFPRPRAAMRNVDAIRARMAQNIAATRSENNICTIEDLVRLGWSKEQILQNFHPAQQRLPVKSMLAEAARTGAEIACICVFLAAIGLWTPWT